MGARRGFTLWTTHHPVDNACLGVGGQADAAAELVPDELVDFPFEEDPDDDDPFPDVELDVFSAGFDELDDESLELAAADFDGSDFFGDSESDDCLPAALRLSLR